MINVDISNVWGRISLPDLLSLEAEVFNAHLALTEGDLLPTPVADPAETAAPILTAARRIRETSDVLVVIGPCPGGRAAIELLQGPHRNLNRPQGSPQIFFTGTDFSTRSFQELCRLLEGKDYSLCVISRTGTEPESGIAFRQLRWMLERKYGTDEANRRIYTVTAPAAGALLQMSRENQWETFPLSDEPFSVLSPAGLLPMAAAGLDIEKLLLGAANAQQEFDLRSYENPVWLYAAVRNLLLRGGITVELLEAFDPAFAAMGTWWQRLFAAKGPFPVPMQLPADLSALDRMIQEGPEILFETLLRFAPSQPDVIIGEDVKDLDRLNALAGQPLSFPEEQTFQAVTQAHAESNVPLITVDCGPLGEETLGELFWFFLLSAAISPRLPGTQPACRPGCDTGRHALAQLLGLL